MSLHQHDRDAVAAPLPRRRLLLLLDPITWLCCEADWFWRYAPRWACRLRAAYTKWFLKQTLSVRMARAAAQGVGFTAISMPAGTAVATIVAWFEEQIRQSTVVRVAPFDAVTCLVYRSPADDDPVQDLIGVWQGEMGHWWSEGADAVAALVPSDHTGLHLVICRISELFAAANRPDPAP